MQQQVLFVIVILLFTVRNITITYRNLQRYCTSFRLGVVYGGTLQSYVNGVNDQKESIFSDEQLLLATLIILACVVHRAT